MTRKLTFLILALFALISGPGWGQTYELVMELDMTTQAVGCGAYNTTTTYGDWKIVYGANNNKGWAYFKMGGKNTTISSYNPCYIYYSANSGVSSKVDKITVSIAAGSLSKSGMSVKSWGVYVYSDSQMTDQIDYVAGGTITNSAAEFDFSPSNGITWASGYYYKVSWDLANTTTTNGIVCVDKITLYKESKPSTEPSITVNPTSIDLGTVNINEEAEATFTVSQANLTSNISLNAENGNLNVTSINFGAGDTEVTYTITPNAAGELSDIITISCDDLEEDITINVSGNAIDPSQFVTYEKVTSADDLIAGKHYIIVGKKNETYYAMGSQKNNNRDAVEIEATETMVQVHASTSLQEFTISGDPTNNYTFYELGLGFLYAASSSSNYLRTEETLDDNGKWTIEIDEETGEATIKAQGDNSRNMMRFNSSSELFSCYSGGQQPVYLYMKENDINNNIYSDTYIDGDISNCLFFSVGKGAALTVTGTIDANIMMFSIVDGSQLIYDNDIPNGTIANCFRKYADDEANQRTAWNLVSVPVKNFNLLPGINITGDYDLYSYNEPTHFWINKKEPANPYIQTTIGTGYLFAMPLSNTHARFGGTGILQGSGQDLSFPLSYTETLADGETNVLKGFNLVGNPFTCNAYVNMDYLVLDETGSNFVNPTSPIKPGDAILVQATAEGQEITFTRNAPTEPENRLDISVSQNRGSIIDNARIRFGGSHAMNKFYLNENSSRLYIPQNGEEFAVISAQSEGEMPLGFKAAQNGTYTITVNTKNVEAEYLHLIDNMTGMDVDLLGSRNQGTGAASYTFEAKTSDYPSRFKLVFSMTGVNENLNNANSFAYISNGNLVIDNIEGETTLQIIDELGRIISTETVSGSYNKALNLKTGLYIINLNGMTQKIVVK